MFNKYNLTHIILFINFLVACRAALTPFSCPVLYSEFFVIIYVRKISEHNEQGITRMNLRAKLHSNANTSTRKLNYELLRIVSACFILFNHISISSNIHTVHNAIGYLNYYLIQFFHLGGKFGVNVFVILGCYFLCDSSFNPKRIYRLIYEVAFYGLLLNLADIYVFSKKLSFLEFMHGFSYWFPFSYIVLLLAIPLLDRLLRSGYGKILCISGSLLFIGLMVYGLLLQDRFFKLITMEHIIGSLWFCYIYILTAYQKQNNFFSKEKYAGYALMIFPLNYLGTFLLIIVTGKNILRDMYSPLCYISALSIFLIFHHMKDENLLKYKRVIVQFSGASLGMYLLQCHNNTIQIWNDTVFRYNKWENSPALFLICILSVCALMLLAALLNLIYRKIVP